MSKKWNKRNSFLFVPASLPHVEAQQEYNIHYLCMSNLALLLEMLDGIVEELVKGQTKGIWAWDCVNQEAVLLILSIMAMLGDNPMQSEFACHIGLCGKFFCWACWVKGKDVLNENPVCAPPGGSGSSTVASVGLPGNNSSDEEVSSDQGPMDEEESDNGMVMVAGTTATKKKSGLCEGIPHNKSESIQKLKSQFAQAQELYGGTKVKVLHTQSGLKDTYHGYFIDRLTALDAEICNLPEEMMSPIWRIAGLDPHRDTPVEILHVILLGFLKYMWWDIINHQLHNNVDKKNELEIKLVSVNIDGLSIDPVATHTLVTYSGSLTG
ncbi:hypothetical protein EDD18DRAFT_1346492 [Armillaria luteobubalina]|uniref:Uncharacterized protein n=1 Tax=Armillaria luteobubalina TaxID=153913 RepID=A0AA39QGJ7_9AGAR|nr:hypothetical protein EDD18DRAFT_1346492 [Armillaria luteobubalina]